MKIAVVGAGYVGLSLAVLLSQDHDVIALDIVRSKVEMINKRISPIQDEYIEKYFREKELKLKATLDSGEAFNDAKYIIICTPTDYDEKQNVFDTSSIDEIIEKIISMNIDTTIVVKSTVPIGFVENIKMKYNIDNIFFSPEFLREGKALYDNLYPSRIIVGDYNKRAEIFASILNKASLNKNAIIKYMNSTEAEAVKLFANAFLALRVSFFNELDTYAELEGLNTKNIIEGICLDPRIGSYYNNPSFGYGGYCLPKDTKQLANSYKDIPHNIIEAIVKSNVSRKSHIANMVLEKKPKTVGIYRLTMKSNSDNFRESAILGVVSILKEYNLDIIIFEPKMKAERYMDCKVEKNLKNFKVKSNVIIANRVDENLYDVRDKLYTRDIFQNN